MQRLGFGLFAAAMLVMAGCSGDKSGGTTGEGTTTTTTGTASGDAKKYRIAVIPKGSTHEFWKSVHAGADEAAKELGIEIIFKGPEKEDDRDSQIKTVEDFITNKVDGIVLAPLDDTALRTPVDEAQKSGIPVVIIDSGLKDVETVSFVATDNYKGGQLAGERMIELLGGKGKVVMLRYQEGSASTMEREQGFMDAVKGKLEVVSSNQYGGATAPEAQAKAENLLSNYVSGNKLSIDGIYTPNESTTFGMLLVLQANKWAGNVKFVGFDASEPLIKGLSDGQIHGLVLQNPRKMGYEGVKTLVSHLKGEKVEKRIDTGANMVTKENMGQEDIKKLLEVPKE